MKEYKFYINDNNEINIINYGEEVVEFLEHAYMLAMLKETTLIKPIKLRTPIVCKEKYITLKVEFENDTPSNISMGITTGYFDTFLSGHIKNIVLSVIKSAASKYENLHIIKNRLKDPAKKPILLGKLAHSANIKYTDEVISPKDVEEVLIQKTNKTKTHKLNISDKDNVEWVSNYLLAVAKCDYGLSELFGVKHIPIKIMVCDNLEYDVVIEEIFTEDKLTPTIYISTRLDITDMSPHTFSCNLITMPVDGIEVFINIMKEGK